MSDHPLSFLRMTPEQREKSMIDNPPTCEGVHDGSAYFDWQWSGCGFGQFSFSYDRETGKWDCSNEMMKPESTRKLLHAFADYVADQLAPVIIKEREEWDAKQAVHEKNSAE